MLSVIGLMSSFHHPKPKRTGRDIYHRIIELQGDPFTMHIDESTAHTERSLGGVPSFVLFIPLN